MSVSGSKNESVVASVSAREREARAQRTAHHSSALGYQAEYFAQLFAERGRPAARGLVFGVGESVHARP